MTFQDQKFEVNQFSGGLNTDSTELTPVQNTSIDEDNFNLLKEGTRRRRLGFDLESATTVDLAEDTTEVFIGTHRWDSVNKQAEINFEVVQVGSTLRFFDASNSTFIAGEKSFTVDLNDFKAPGATRTDLDGISTASGKGALFVTGKNVNPFYIEYDPDNDTISTTQIDMKIRDLTQLDTQDPESGTLTPQRRYDLLNQGWYQTGVIIGSSTQIVKIKTKSKNPDTSIPGYSGTILDGYIERFGSNPPKTKPWWVGKGTITVDVHIKVPGIFNDIKETKEVEAFSKEAFDLHFGGNTVAPLGHYLVNPFYRDRAAASGIQGLAPEIETDRPSAVAFYGGRAFYGLNNTIYFSQVILDDLQAAGRCYQEADPTAEDSIGLIASDGGTITIPDMGRIIRLFVVEGALLIFADNGVWTLYSPQGRGFSATNFTVDHVTTLRAVGYHSIVDVEGYPLYWGEEGIYSIEPIDERVAYRVRDLSDRKIKNYIQDNISFLSKQYAKGVYDLDNRRVMWLWKSSTDPNTNRFEYDRMLNYSIVFDAFFPYSFAIHQPGDGNDARYAVCGIVEASAIATSTSEVNVVVGNYDSNFDSVQWYYPLNQIYSYTDLGPDELADATPNGSGAIISTDITNGPEFPSGTAYNNTGSNSDYLNHPDNSLPDTNGGDWTLDFWVWSDAYVGGFLTSNGIFAADSSAVNTFIKVGTFNDGTRDVFDVAVLDLGTQVNLRSTGSSTAQDNETYYISITRNGNTLYLHINGVEHDSADVTGLNMDFSSIVGARMQWLTAGVGSVGFTSSLRGYISEIRWTNAARYGAGNYTVPTTVHYEGTSSGVTNVVNDADEQVVIDQTTITENDIDPKFLVLKNSIAATDAELAAGNFTDTSFVDWDSTGFSDDYTSYIETMYHLSDDSMTYMQAPWIYTYIKRSSTTFPAAEGDGSIDDSETGGAWASVT